MLQVAEKKFNGVTVGYVVGRWVCKRWKWSGESEFTFRSFRNGVLFKTADKAKEFRDKVEKRRVESSIEFVKVEN